MDRGSATGLPAEVHGDRGMAIAALQGITLEQPALHAEYFGAWFGGAGTDEYCSKPTLDFEFAKRTLTER